MNITLARVTLAVLLTVAAATPSLAQPASGALAKGLTEALTSRHLDTFAAKDPAAADGFVAALVYPGVQLLVVSARYPVAAHLDISLASAGYRDVYSALQSNGIPESRLFVQDMGADGLRADSAQAVDIVYRHVKDQVVFSGNVGDGDYRRNLSTLDAEYSRVLRILIDALAKVPATATAASVR